MCRPRVSTILSGTAYRSSRVGSSAGGEQAKFLANNAAGHPTLVKFSPPRGTPYGELWNNLLHAEALAAQVLSEQGVNVAQCRVVQTQQRSYLESLRFDRHGPRGHGRSHTVALHAVHQAFVSGPARNWAATCEELERQRRLPAGTARQVQALRDFGQLIGNNDMHFGNLSLRVDQADVARGRFTLAPLYDMLPMRWRPDILSRDMTPLPFGIEAVHWRSAARPVAAQFWQRLAEHTAVGRDFRGLAAEMLHRVNTAGPA